ncbi:hypothetical protein BDR26DRAFT_997804 [Obelidium mucronatum]|nr:hypothetical protein BDR26DRAFT_997804 [Obelidium mucronatum]
MLHLQSNKLSGPIPDSIGNNLVNLQELDLHHNCLTGSIPDSLGNLYQLKRLQLSHNRFTGSLSSVRFKNLVNLIELDVSNNQIDGEIPDLGGLTKLAHTLANPNSLAFSSWYPVQQFRSLFIQNALLQAPQNQLERLYLTVGAWLHLVQFTRFSRYSVNPVERWAGVDFAKIALVPAAGYQPPPIPEANAVAPVSVVLLVQTWMGDIPVDFAKIAWSEIFQISRASVLIIVIKNMAKFQSQIHMPLVPISLAIRSNCWKPHVHYQHKEANHVNLVTQQCNQNIHLLHVTIIKFPVIIILVPQSPHSIEDPVFSRIQRTTSIRPFLIAVPRADAVGSLPKPRFFAVSKSSNLPNANE